jgi:hypothetical protein
MFNYFYHGTIRKYVVCFGTLFNNIYVSKTQQDGSIKKYRVPLSYAGKEKYIRRIQEFETLIIDEDSPKDATYLPRMSFELTSLSYDSIRKRNSLSKTKVYEPTSNSLSYTYAEVPYNLEFTLSILTRKMDEGLQIVEQILPYFAPDFNLTIDLAPFAKKIDVPITMISYSQSVEYEGEVDENMDYRVISFDLIFNVRGYLFGPSKNASIIKESITQFFDFDGEGRERAIVVDLTGGTGSSGATFNPETYGTRVRIFGADATNSDIFG